MSNADDRTLYITPADSEKSQNTANTPLKSKYTAAVKKKKSTKVLNVFLVWSLLIYVER